MAFFGENRQRVTINADTLTTIANLMTEARITNNNNGY